MYSHSVFTTSDNERAKFSAMFITYREHFSKQMSLEEALIYLLTNLEQSSIVLSFNEHQQVIAAMNYWLTSDDEFTYDANGGCLYISSVIIHPEQRSSRVFMQGFRDSINYIDQHVLPKPHTVAFAAQDSNPYVNKLYRKFATFSGQREGFHGLENIYKVNFNDLKYFLNRLKSK